MPPPTRPLPLNRTLLKILVNGLFIPSAILALALIGLNAYLNARYLGQEQLQLTRSMALRLDDFLRHAVDALNSTAEISRTSTLDETQVHLDGMRVNNPYFNSLYILDGEAKVIAISPLDPLYLGLDMSNQAYYRQRDPRRATNISRPFISSRTGQLTVYLSRTMLNGYVTVGELSLDKLQEVVESEPNPIFGQVVFVTDASGTLLAHPDTALVAQQANLAYVQPWSPTQKDIGQRIILVEGEYYFQSTTPLEEAPWIVTSEVPVIRAYWLNLVFLGFSGTVLLGLWLLILLGIRRQIFRQIVQPLTQLSQTATALAEGDTSRRASLADEHPAFTEIHELANNFEHMLGAIEERQAALRQREKTEREQRILAEALRNTAAAITSTLDFEEVLDRILDNVGRVVPHSVSNIMLLLGEAGETVRMAAARGYENFNVQDWATQQVFPLGRFPGLMWMKRTGEALLISNTAQSQFWVSISETAWIASYVGAPIRDKGVVIGFLNLDSTTPNFFTQQHAGLLQAFADQAGTAIQNARLLSELQNSHDDLLIAYDTTLQGLAKALALRDNETQGHSVRVTDMTMRLSKRMGLTEPTLTHIRYGALLHDIGKIAIPDSILYKNGPLSEQEWEVMRLHPTYAQQLLATIPYLKDSMDIPLYHHERWDGSGYPFGLRGEQIPLAARIFCVIDVWDGLRSERPYHPAWPEAQVREYLLQNSGSHFDPEIVQSFLKLLKEEAPLLLTEEKNHANPKD